jgi:hypothetical protein
MNALLQPKLNLMGSVLAVKNINKQQRKLVSRCSAVHLVQIAKALRCRNNT